MSTPQERFDETLMDFVDRLAGEDLTTKEATTAVRNLETFSKCRPPKPTPPPEPEPVVDTTTLGKVKALAASVWDNETTRVLIKAGGAFASVALVAWSTIHRDHVLDRQSLAQANQRPS